jgi:hypothetical protein
MLEILEDELQELSQPTTGEAGCISLYMPTHRKYPENQQNPIRFKNLAKSVIEQIGKSNLFSAEEVGVVDKELATLEGDREFWNHRVDGLAWFFRDGHSHLFDFQRSVDELVVVARSIHIKPLIRVTQAADRFHVLALTRHTAKLYAGNRDALDEVHIEQVPATMEEALGKELSEPHLGAASYGGTDRAMFHGHSSRDEEVDKDRERYFRAVATAIEKHWSNPSRVPLILVALSEHHAQYRSVSSDRFLLDEGVSKDPESMSLGDLRRSTSEIIRQRYQQQLNEYSERLGDAQANRKGSAVVSDVLREAANGRVELLLLEDDARLAGRVDWATGRIDEADVSDSDDDDVLDDLAEMVITRGGSVRMVDAGSLKSESKLGALYRY